MAHDNPDFTWTRRELKKNARFAVKRNYRHVAIVSLLTFFLVRGLYNFTGGGTVKYIHLAAQGQSNARVIINLVSDLDHGFLQNLSANLPGAAVLTSLFDNLTRPISYLFGFVSAFDQLIFGNRAFFFAILFAGTLLAVAYNVFVRNIVQVGVARFFLENNHYEKSLMGRIGYLYQIGKVGNVAKIMFLKNLFLLCWDLTIVGGLIKRYSYRMIPLILAENPGISRRDAFILSRKMMDGQKWRVFVLDCSFLLWLIPTVLTLGIFDYLGLFPYRSAVDAALYFKLRGKSIEMLPEARLWLIDAALIPGGDVPPAQYPVADYLYPVHERRKWTVLDYKAAYSIYSLILFFFSFSIFGWVWEVGLNLFYTGDFIDKGTLYGPLLPIYGTGGVLILLVLKRFRARPLLFFFLTMLLCGVVEYTAAWYLATFRHAVWWDYSNMRFNIQGRVCLEGLLCFGLGGCLFTYILAPLLNKAFLKIPFQACKIICIALVVAFTGDFIYAQFHPNMAAAKTISSLKMLLKSGNHYS